MCVCRAGPARGRPANKRAARTMLIDFAAKMYQEPVTILWTVRLERGSAFAALFVFRLPALAGLRGQRFDLTGENP
jgi:hypothetical protein